jgi:hypothetical protein
MNKQFGTDEEIVSDSARLMKDRYLNSAILAFSVGVESHITQDRTPLRG